MVIIDERAVVNLAVEGHIHVGVGYDVQNADAVVKAVQNRGNQLFTRWRRTEIDIVNPCGGLFQGVGCAVPQVNIGG